MTTVWLSWAGGLAIGAVGWTLLEYVLHRWAFHQRVLGRAMAKEHVRHHAEVDYFAPLALKLALAVPVLSAVTAVSVLAVGTALGASVPIGLFGGWVFYEVLHRRIHTHAPLHAYGRWARRHHLSHHFGHADRNHGVTSALWDRVFGTLEPVASVEVPRRHVAKFPWMLDADAGGAAGPRIAAAFAEDYRLR